MASKSIMFSAAFLALVSLVAGRALEELELVRDPSLVHGIQRVRTVPSILVPLSQVSALPYGGSGFVGERNPNPVVQRPARGSPLVSSDGVLLGSGYVQPHLVTGPGVGGLGRSDVPLVGNRPASGSGLGLGYGLGSELGRQYQSGVVPVQLNSQDQQGYVPLPFYPGNVPLNPVNPVNYPVGYNSGYMPYYYTYVAGYVPQPIVV